MRALEQKREHLKDSWASGTFTASFTTEMLAKNAGATGACSALEEIITMDYQMISGVFENEQ